MHASQTQKAPKRPEFPCGNKYFNILHMDMVTSASENRFFRAPAEGHIFGFVTKGCGTLETAKEQYPVTQGDFYYIQKDTPFLLTPSTDDSFERFFLELDGALTEDLTSSFHLNGITVISRDVSRFFTEIRSRTEGMKEESKPEALRRIACLLFEMLTELRIHEFFSHRLQKQSTAEAIRSYLDNNLYNDISLESVTENFGISKMHAIRLFKREYNTTPMQYLTDRRLTLAKSLLSDTVMPIREISELLHYSNTQHFSNAFKSAVGVPPNQYRKGEQTK